MRLRLTVRRNGVPEVKLMWHAELDTDFTVSRLLAGVNDVVPLESAEWGLEDYAVEYKDGEDGFECLHFQVVKDILKEDDQVLIRPLLENDLRRRQLSGRHQITADGRHLVDGVAFGRPWLRAPVNRPGIELPPRKRARISYRDEDRGIDSETDNSVHTSDDDYAASSVILSEDEEQLLLEGADKDEGDVKGGASEEGPGTIVGEGIVKDGASDQEIPTPATDDSADIGSLREESPPLPAYPGEAEPSPAAPPQTLSSILHRLKGKDAPASATVVKKDAAREPGSASSSSSDDTGSSEDSSDISSSDSDASDSISSSDSDSDSSSDLDSRDGGRDAPAFRWSASHKSKPGPPPASDSSDSSDSKSTSGPSEEDVKGRASGTTADKVSSDSSDSDSSDSSDSSSGSSVAVSQKNKAQKAAPAPAPKAVPQASKPVAAGAAPPLTRTQKRNIRKRELKRHHAEQAAAAALAQGVAGAAPAAGMTPQDDEFMKRRQALLESLDASASQTVTPRKRKADDESESKAATQNHGAPPSAATQDSTASQSKMRFDLGAPRRLLLGALGLGTKSKEEQKPDAQTNDLAQMNGHDEAQETNAVKEPEDPDAWKDKIIYRAVECSREGVELSEPPFPFVQRWDPQQRVDVWYGNKRGGRGKRKQRDQAHYYEEGPGHSKKRKVEPEPWPEELDYDEGANGDGDLDVNGDVNGNGGAEHSNAAPGDLPPLPEDMNTLAPLTRGEATPGMVITWKQWLLSKATNWQPQFGNVTAAVAQVDENDDDTLHVVLAKRDRGLDRNEKEYDVLTGQRIYGGFEAPDLDEEGEGAEGEDQGHRIVSLREMMEPRVVHLPTAGSLQLVKDLPGGEEDVVPESLPQDGQGAELLPQNGQDDAESLPQDGQGDANFEPFSVELQVPFSTDPVVPDGDSGAEQAADSADRSQRNGLDVPSGVDSVASGRRQPDPNSLPVSLELDMIPDSAHASLGGTKEGRKSRSQSQKMAAGEDAAGAKAPSDSDEAEAEGADEIKPAGGAESFFEMGDKFLPKKLRREGSVTAVKKEREGSLPKLLLPEGSPPRFGSQGRGRKKGSSPFDIPAGSQVIDLVSEGEGGESDFETFGTPVGSQRQNGQNGTPGSQRNGTPRGSQNGTPRGGSQNGTPASQRSRKGTPASQKMGQKGDLTRGPGWVKKRKGFSAETV